jgi:hypothetical protein
MRDGPSCTIPLPRAGAAFAGILIVAWLSLAHDDRTAHGQTPNRYSSRKGVRPYVAANRNAAGLEAAATPCPPPVPQQLYRFVAGIDRCMTRMTRDELSRELNDPWAKEVLRKNAGGVGTWPTTVPEIVSAITASQGTSAFEQFSYLVGEGTQVPISIAPRAGNRDLRYVLTWGPSGSTPAIYLSGSPPGVAPNQPPPFLQVISFDPQKQAFNYYQYIDNFDVGADANPGKVKTWSWAGDSSHSRRLESAGRGCFLCHRNGGLNMKELTPPWNNWHSPQASVSSTVIPQGVASDPLFIALAGADRFQTVFQGAQFNLAKRLVQGAIQNGQVSGVPELLRHLIETTTINLASSQTRSDDTTDVSGLPKDFFLNDSALGGALDLSYRVPDLKLSRSAYDGFIRAKSFQLVNRARANGSPDYQSPGATFFAFLVPVPAYEDVQTIGWLVRSKVISQKFAVSVLMVDFPNPVFSPVRGGLMKYARQITSSKLTPDASDVPTQFAARVKGAAAGQPACDTANITQCTAEQQFLYYWNQTDWKTAAGTQINAYLANVGSRVATTTGAEDYLTLSTSRGIQFSFDPLVGGLHEFDLLLPCTSLGEVYKQMNADGMIISRDPSTGNGFTPCAAR